MQENLDKIYIRDLLLRCIVGINPEERREKQDVIINVALNCDLRHACSTDCIEDTIDYKNIKKGIISLVENSSFLLIEKLCGEIAALCLKNKRVQGCDCYR